MGAPVRIGKSAEYLEVIKESFEEKGRSPSLRELASRFGVCHSVAQYHVGHLEALGHITIREREAYGIRVNAGR